MAGHPGPHSEGWVQPPSEVGYPPAQRSEERSMDWHSRIPRSQRPVVVEGNEVANNGFNSVSSRSPWVGIALRLWESRRPCWHAGDSVSAGGRTFGPAGIEVVHVALRSSFQTPARALPHLPPRAVSLVVQGFNAILYIHNFPSLRKHALVTYFLKPWKDPILPSSYRPISLLDTIGKLLEKILLVKVIHEVSERGLMRDEQFGFRTRHSTSMQLARLVERIIRKFGEKNLPGAVFLVVAKAFYTVWINVLLYKLTLLNFPFYIVHTISPYLRGRTFEAPFQMAPSSLRGMQAKVAQCGLISPVVFSLYVKDILSLSHHVELVLYGDDTAIIATSRNPTLLLSYLKSYLNKLQR